MNIASIMDEIATTLNGVGGIRAYGWPPESVTPPAAILPYPDMIEFDQTYGRGSDAITFEMLCAFGRPYDKATRAQVSTSTAGTGTGSIKAALSTHAWTSCSKVRAHKVTFDVAKFGGTDCLVALFELRVFGSGS